VPLCAVLLQVLGQAVATNLPGAEVQAADQLAAETGMEVWVSGRHASGECDFAGHVEVHPDLLDNQPPQAGRSHAVMQQTSQGDCCT